jgi:hypothetical protein
VIECAIFSNKEGAGYIADSVVEMERLCNRHAEVIQFGSEKLIPDCMTDLDGFYSRYVKYIGVKHDSFTVLQHSLFMQEGAKELVLHIGQHEGKEYFKSVIWVSPERFYIQYQPSGGRDYNRVNGKWN